MGGTREIACQWGSDSKPALALRHGNHQCVRFNCADIRECHGTDAIVLTERALFEFLVGAIRAFAAAKREV